MKTKVIIKGKEQNRNLCFDLSTSALHIHRTRVLILEPHTRIAMEAAVCSSRLDFVACSRPALLCDACQQDAEISCHVLSSKPKVAGNEQ